MPSWVPDVPELAERCRARVVSSRMHERHAEA